MTKRADADPGREPVDSMIEELIHDLMQQDTGGHILPDAAADPLTGAFAGASAFEKILVADVLARSFAAALAPALASALAPEIVAALESVPSAGAGPAGERGGGAGPATNGRSRTGDGKRTTKPGNRKG